MKLESHGCGFQFQSSHCATVWPWARTRCLMSLSFSRYRSLMQCLPQKANVLTMLLFTWSRTLSFLSITTSNHGKNCKVWVMIDHRDTAVLVKFFFKWQIPFLLVKLPHYWGKFSTSTISKRRGLIWLQFQRNQSMIGWLQRNIMAEQRWLVYSGWEGEHSGWEQCWRGKSHYRNPPSHITIVLQ